MKRILVVDDSSTARRIFKACLPSDRSYIIDVAQDCDTALEKARENLPDLVLCDYNMPGRNGVEVAIEFADAGLDTKFVLVTANLQQTIIEAAKEAGFVATIRKPLSREKVVKCLDEVGL